MYFAEDGCNINIHPGSFTVHFPSNTTTVEFSINITDDDVYEHDEPVVTIYARNVDVSSHDWVPRGTSTSRIAIRDDENSMQAISVIKFVLLFASHKHVIKEIL